jgi:hypothetical protein
MDIRLLNGKPKVTIIVRFDHSAAMIGPDRKKCEFPSLASALEDADRRGFDVNVSHLHPAGAWKKGT